MELVEKNILPVESSLKEALIGEEAQTPCVHLQADAEGGGGLWTSCPSISCFDLGN